MKRARSVTLGTPTNSLAVLASVLPSEIWGLVYYHVIDQRVAYYDRVERVPDNVGKFSTMTLDKSQGKRTKFANWDQLLTMLAVPAKVRRAALVEIGVRIPHYTYALPLLPTDLIMAQNSCTLASIGLRILPGDITAHPGMIKTSAFFRHLLEWHFQSFDYLVLLSSVYRAWRAHLLPHWAAIYARFFQIVSCHYTAPGSMITPICPRWDLKRIPSRWYKLQILRLGIRARHFSNDMLDNPEITPRGIWWILNASLGWFMANKRRPVALAGKQFLQWLKGELVAIEVAIPKISKPRKPRRIK